jgi:hypothetical protein
MSGRRRSASNQPGVEVNENSIADAQHTPHPPSATSSPAGAAMAAEYKLLGSESRKGSRSDGEVDYTSAS